MSISLPSRSSSLTRRRPTTGHPLPAQSVRWGSRLDPHGERCTRSNTRGSAMAALRRCVLVLGVVLATIGATLVTAPTAAAEPDEFNKSSWCTTDTAPFLLFPFSGGLYPEPEPVWQLRRPSNGEVVASGTYQSERTKPVGGQVMIEIPSGLPAGQYDLYAADSDLSGGTVVEAYDCVTVTVNCAKLTFSNPSSIAAWVELYGPDPDLRPVQVAPGRSLDVRLKPGQFGWVAWPQDASHPDEMGGGRVDVPPCASLTATPRPVLTGKPQVGRTLRADPGAWKPAPVTLTYRWLRNGAPITGATGLSYVPTRADLGTYLSFQVVGRKAGYWTSVQVSSDTPRIKPGT